MSLFLGGRPPGRARRQLMATLAGWAILGAAATGVVACSAAAAETSVSASSSSATASSTATDNTATDSSTADATTGESSTTESPTSEYADGTYTATGSYSTPGGIETISVTLTIADGVITEATAVGDARQPPSSQYQDAFESSFASLVVGVSLDEVELDSVAGASLTPEGFTDAVDQIQTDALA